MVVYLAFFADIFPIRYLTFLCGNLSNVVVETLLANFVFLDEEQLRIWIQVL